MTTEHSATGWPVQFTGVLTIGLVAATFVQACLSVLSSYLLHDFGLTRTGLGLALTTFGLFGAAAAPFMGRACDRVGGRAVLVLVFVVSGAALLALSVAPGVTWILAVGAVGGIALGAGNPATNKLSADNVAGGHQGAVMGVKQSGPPLGVLFAGLILPAVAAALGWRWALALTAIVPGVGLAWLLRIVPREPRPREIGHDRRSRSPVARATTWWLTGIGVLVATGVAGVLAFLPLYAQQAVGFSTAQAGLLAGFVGVMGIAGRIVWSWQGERFRRLTTVLAILGMLSIAGTALFWAAQESGATVLWMGAFVSGISMMSWHAVAWLAVVTDVEAAGVGAASGVVHFGSSIGFGVGPLIFGLVADHFGYPWAWGTLAGLFGIATLATFIWMSTAPLPAATHVVRSRAA